WRPGWISRIAFVAPKLDRVHPMDRDRMVELLRRMIGKYARDFDGLAADFFNCAAVVSTQVFPRAAERGLLGPPAHPAEGRVVPPEGEPKKLTVSELPDDWPENWAPGRYFFPEVWPRVPARKDCPPEQINLDRILNFVLR